MVLVPEVIWAANKEKAKPKLKPKFKITVTHRETPNRVPVATTAHVIDETGNVAIGVAVCSLKDRFNGKIGRKIAVGRAFYAMREQHDCREINRAEALDQLSRIMVSGHTYTHKCMYISAVPS